MNKKLFIFILFYFLIFGFSLIAYATEPQTTTDPITPPGSSDPVSLINPLGGTQAAPKGTTDIPVLLGKIISSVLGVVGSLALVMFIYGGITWMLSAGNQEQVTKGKNILIWATIGIVIIFTAYALVRFVLTTVTGT